MYGSEAREQSEFNDALSYLRRINTCLTTADIASTNLDFFAWFHALMAFRRELSTEIKDDEITVYDPLIMEINQQINRVVTSNGRLKYSGDVYMKLDYFERSLRKIYKDSGLQMKMKEDARSALR